MTTLTVTNWRSFQGAHTFTFGRTLTTISAPNGCGKSSLLDAMRWCLTGRCRGTDAGGRGAGELVTTGEAQGSVVLEIADSDRRPMTVSRAVGRASMLSVSVSTGQDAAQRETRTGDAAQAWLVELFGAQATLAASLDGARLLSADHATAKGILMDALDVLVPIDGLTWPAAVGVTPTAAHASLADLDAWYKLAYEARREAKTRALPYVDEEALRATLPDLATIEAKIAALEEERAGALRTEGGRAARAEAAAKALQAHEAAEARIARATDALSRLRDREGVEPVACPADDWPDLFVSLMRAKAALATDAVAALEQAADEASARETDAKAAHLTAQARHAAGLELPTEHDPKRGCVLAAEIPCKTSKAAFATYCQVQSKAASERAVAANATMGAWATAKGVAEDAARKVAQARAALSSVTRATAEVVAAATAALSARRSDALLDGDSAQRLRAELNEIANGADTAQADALAARIAKGRETLARARTAHREAAEAQKAQEARQEAAREVEALEVLVEALGPKGRRVAALEAALADFTSGINEALPSGLSVAFALEPWKVLVNGRPAALLAQSEELRVGAILGAALAAQGSLGVVLVDAFDLLDQTTRRETTGALRAMAADLDLQVVIAATRDQPSAAADTDAMRAIWLG